MLPIYRRRRLSKRARSRSSYRVPVPFDPRVLRFLSSSSNNAHVMRPLLQLVQRQHAALVALPARIRQARSDLEKRLEEVNKRLEIFSELNDAYQALIDKLKGEQRVQSQKIERLKLLLERFERGAALRNSRSQGPEDESAPSSSSAASVVLVSVEESAGNSPTTLIADPENNCGTGEEEEAMQEEEEEQQPEEEQQVEHQSLETEIIYDFVV